MIVLITTRVLVGPLNGEDRALVIVDTANIVSTTVVVLGVKQSVGIISLPISLIQSVV